MIKTTIINKDKKFRVCAHCEHIWFGQSIACPKCQFGAHYDAVWCYGGLRFALIMYFKQKINLMKGNFKNYENKK